MSFYNKKFLTRSLFKNNIYLKRISYKNPQKIFVKKFSQKLKEQFKYIGSILIAGYFCNLAYDYFYQNSSLQEFLKFVDENKVSYVQYAQNVQNKSIKSVEITFYADNKKYSFVTRDINQIYKVLKKYKNQNTNNSDKQLNNKVIQTNSKKQSIINELVLLLIVGSTFKILKNRQSTMNAVRKFENNKIMIEEMIPVQENKHFFKKQKKTGINFKDVAGMDEAKLEIQEFVDFLKNPEKYKKIGAKIPRGALLSGPPGTGKTLLAKACAGEAQVPFYSVSGSEFVEVFVGVGAQRVRELFKTAKKDDVAIIFIDEIDSIGRKRASERSNSEHDSTLNQLLVEMDGFNTEQNIVVFGATNKKEMLDPALLRAGRFDRQIEVALPTLEGREQIFRVHLKPLKLESQEIFDYMAKRLASLTPGFSGAEIYNVCNEAAIQAARNNHQFVQSEDFESAVERVIAGLEKQKQNNDEEKKIVAVHESGHAVVSWFLEGAMPLLKVTIIPRSKGALGFAQYLPNENQLQTKEEIIDQITSILGGRIAEQEFFGKVTTGAYDDLQKAYKMAQTLVRDYGMDDELGFVSYQEDSYGRRQYSQGSQEKIDERIKNIINQCTKNCQEIVRQKKDLIQTMSENLLQKQTLDLKQIIKILGQRPFKPKKSFEAFLNA